MSWNNVIPWWMLGPCKFKRHIDPDGNPEGSDWDECIICGRLTRFRPELMRQCVAEGVKHT